MQCQVHSRPSWQGESSAAGWQPRSSRALRRPSCCGCATRSRACSTRRARSCLPKDFVRLAHDGREGNGAFGCGRHVAVRRAAWLLVGRDGCCTLGLDRKMLPPVRGSAGVTGALTADAAEALGLRQGIPVVGGGADNAAAAVGSGVVEQGAMQASIGTSGTMLAPIERPRVDPGYAVASVQPRG